MSDQHLKEAVSNFLYELGMVSSNDPGFHQPYSISEAIEKFGEVSCAEMCLETLPDDIPRWQVCLWMSENLRENIRKCSIQDIFSLCFSMRGHLTLGGRILYDLQQYFSHLPSVPDLEPEQEPEILDPDMEIELSDD